MATYLKKFLFLVTIILLCGFFWSKATWVSVNSAIDKLSPPVTSISTDTLKTLLQSEKNITIVDVRATEEFEVSHLPGAMNLTDAKEIEFPKDTTIVVYCSVGIRSAYFAQKLSAGGYTSVFNLRGSIFEWANKGYPLKRGNKDVHVVHPYNKKWGQLLNQPLHAYDIN
jgi:rhodanese-related sulfurtransferase